MTKGSNLVKLRPVRLAIKGYLLRTRISQEYFTDLERLTQAHERVQQENARLQDERARAEGKHGSETKKAAGYTRVCHFHLML